MAKPLEALVDQALNQAADLLEKPNAWTRTYLARDQNGNPVDNPKSPRAVCWCALGAIGKVSDSTAVANSAAQKLRHFISRSIGGFNDTHTQPEVVAKLREAARGRY